MLRSPLKYPAFLNANARLPQMHQVRRSILEKLRRRIEEESSSPEPDPHLRSRRPQAVGLQTQSIWHKNKKP